MFKTGETMIETFFWLVVIVGGAALIFAILGGLAELMEMLDHD